jgi:peroxiredoxin
MALTYSPEEPALGSKAPDFDLLDAVSGKRFSLHDFSEAKALAVVFMCKHCPYVEAVQGRIAALAKEFAPKGGRFVAIASNDTVKYPEDSPANLKKQAASEGFIFPYLLDETQSVARAYGAVCTPDFFVYGRGSSPGEFLLRYRGRLDDSWKDETKVKSRDLAQALTELVSGRVPSAKQIPTMGCSIKWKS